MSLLTIAAIGILQALPCFAANADDFTPEEQCPAPGAASKSDDAVRVGVIEAFGKLPLSFEANRGQTDSQVRFLSRSLQHTLLLAPTEAVLVFVTREHPEGSQGHGAKAKLGKPGPATRTVLRMTFLGANPDARVTGREELPGKANYFVGNDPASWRTNVPTYARVHYEDLYPGIDLVYYGNQRQLEYDFVVRPAADPRRIALSFRGAHRLEVDSQGDLVLHTTAGAIRQSKPIIYQEVAGRRVEIPGGYVLRDGQRVGFHVAAYDTSLPLIIDPSLAYSTYLGGSGFDEGRGIAVDSTGNAYVTGSTDSIDFPTTTGVFQTACDTGPGFCSGDVFVTKLNPAGSALVYSTYLGGSGFDQGFGIAVDSTGNAYVTGVTTSTNFPTTAGAFQTATGGPADSQIDAFVTKLNPTGSGLVYSTYLGGNGFDEGFGIAVDSTFNAYVTGFTSPAADPSSPNFPTTPGAFQTVFGGGPSSDAFVTKLNPAGSALVYSTYLGGSDADVGSAIAVGAGGNAYVTGFTGSTDFPTTGGAFQTVSGGLRDAFVTKLNPTGSAPLVYSTYLGGSGDDEGLAIAVDASGNAYVTGDTDSTNFPIMAGAFQTAFGGGSFDAFVTQVAPTGATLTYSTYLGGNGDDQGAGVAVDASGNAYVTGSTGSTDFPTTAGAFRTASGGNGDAFVTTLAPTGSTLVFSTYLGGSGFDIGTGITVDAMSSPNAYVVGFTDSSDFPTTTGAFDTTFNGGDDTFVARIADIVPAAAGGPPETKGKVTGGGYIKVIKGGRSGKGTFGLEAHRKTLDEPVHGTVEYHNHLTDAELHGIVNSLSVDQTTRTFHLAGTCRCGSSCAVFQVDGQDVREPGKNADKFTITYCTSAGPPATGCTTDGAPPNDVIVSGNLQVHKQ
ncbi:MAG TPA: SBBP repeat-containing protein [Candidatus Binatia bacterium]|nr:SBBP repeat-containing protein [Candidatus Binatia bacterium]